MDTKVNFSIVEYQGQRVLTTEQLAQAYECSEDQIKVNFTRNKKRFEEGKHYFNLEGYELKEFKSNYLADCNSVDNKVTKSNPVENCSENFVVVGKNAKSLYLWTKRGASRHCKMLGTDRLGRCSTFSKKTTSDRSRLSFQHLM